MIHTFVLASRVWLWGLLWFPVFFAGFDVVSFLG